MNYRQIFHHSIWLVVVLSATSFYIAMIIEIDKRYDKYYVSKAFNWLYTASESNGIFRWMLCLFIISAFGVFAHKWFHDKKANICSLTIRLILGVVITYVCLCDEYWKFAHICYNVTFAHILCGIAIIACFYSLWLYVRNINNAKSCVGERKEPFEQGECVRLFTTDFIEDKHISNSISLYAKELSERMWHTTNQEEAFAIGVAGSWGSGKTTFLKALRKEISKEMVIMNFEPWNCKSPAVIIEDFFSSFRDLLSVHVDPFLSKPVTSYAQHLNTINRMDPWWAFGRNLALAHYEDDTTTLKKRISESLKLSKKKIVVFVDDIDRLDKDELYEVLRLVRNTANLPYLYYVVTYDKDYVVKLLARKGINAPAIYLEKIFNVEVMLPKVTRFDLLNVLYSDMKQMIDEDLVEKIEECVIEQNLTYIISHLLTNYREVKRFARQFAMHYTFAKNNLNLAEFNIFDLFLLELIRYVDFNVYNVLRDDPSQILDWSKNSNPKITALKKNILEELSAGFEGKRKFNRYLLEIIKRLFGEQVGRQSNSVAYANNFTRYFTLGVEDKKIYQYELDCLLNSDADTIKSTLASWFLVDEKQKKDAESLLFLISQTDSSVLTTVQWRNLILILEGLYANNVNNASLHRVLHVKLQSEQIPEGDKEGNRKWLFNRLSHLFINSEYAILFFRICKSNLHCNKILNDDDLTKLMNLVFNNYVNNDHPDAIDILDKNSKLFALISNAFQTYYPVDEYENGFEDYHENLIWDSMKEYYKENRSKEIQRFDEFFRSSITDQEMYEGLDPNAFYENYLNRVTEYFRSEDFLLSYRESCFETNDNTAKTLTYNKKSKSNKKNNKDNKKVSKTKLLKKGLYIKQK